MKLTRILRIIHRDLGFFVVGLTLVYAISGILLNHLGKNDPAFRTEMVTMQVPVNLTEAQLLEFWTANKNLPSLNRILRIDDIHSRLLLEGGVGVYNSSSGNLNYETHTRRPLIFWINRLHYNKVRGWTPVADFFAGSLILLAITGLFIVKGKKGIAGTGKWYLIVGILVPVLYGIIFLR